MKHPSRIPCLFLALLVAGCEGTTPEKKAAQDARDVAQVKAAQQIRPPVQPIAPEPISVADFVKASGITGPADAVSKLPDEPARPPADRTACGFSPATSGSAVFALDAKHGLLKLGGELVVFAADSGSTALAPGLHAKYAGRDHTAQLARTPDMLTIRDRFDRIVYQSGGTLACHG